MQQRSARVVAFLQDVERRMKRLEPRLRPRPTCFSIPEAAERIGIEADDLEELLRRGRVRVSLVGRERMVTDSEVRRARKRRLN